MARATCIYIVKAVPVQDIVYAGTVKYRTQNWLLDQPKKSLKGLWVIRVPDEVAATPDNSRVYTAEEFLND